MRSGLARRAFTLTEALVSMTILATSIIGLTSAFNLASRASSQALRMSQAMEVADSRLRYLVGESADGVAASGAEGLFAWETRTRQLDSGLRLGTAVVRWMDQGQVRSVELSEVFLPRQERE